jgi:hypothetical protein
VSEPEVDPLRVETGPIELPIAGWYPLLVGLGAAYVTLFLEPTSDPRQPRFELEIRGPFVYDHVNVTDAAAAATLIDPLVHHEIQAANTTPSDELLLEFTRGELLSAASWTLRASDRRAWAPQPGGGIAIWTGEPVRRIPAHSEAGPSTTEGAARHFSHGAREEESIVDVGAGLDLPGSACRLVSAEVEETGRLSLQLGAPSSAARPASADRAVDPLRAFEFFAELRGDAAATPPDPEVFDAMVAAVKTADDAVREAVWIAMDGVEPPIGTIAPRVLSRLGDDIAAVRGEPGGRLNVSWGDGLNVSATTWWVAGNRDTNWAAADGVVTRTEHPRVMLVPPAELRALAEAWLDHDRTGRDSRFWAWTRAADVVQKQAAGGWMLIRFLVEGAADEGQLMSIAAGPLEDYLGEHGPAVMDELEAAARSDPKLLRALAGLWKNWIDDDVWARIQKLLDRSPT